MNSGCLNKNLCPGEVPITLSWGREMLQLHVCPMSQKDFERHGTSKSWRSLLYAAWHAAKTDMRYGGMEKRVTYT